jgi:hypothetical protein
MINVTVRFELHFPVVHVGPGIMENFETGCRLQALLMFPGTSQIAQRQRASLALGAAFAAEQVRSAPYWADQLRRGRPEFFTVPPVVQRNALRKLTTELRHRTIAGLMARAFTGYARSGDDYELPPGLSKIDPSNVAAWVAAHHNLKTKDNILHRAWRPSLPVLPLVIGLDTVFYRDPADDQLSIWEKQIEPHAGALDCQDIETWRQAVLLSKLALPIVQQAPKIRIRDSEIVRIIWHD